MNASIYLIKNSINNKVYVGQTTQKVEDRFNQHLKCLKTNENQAISKAIKKYGKDKFSVEVLHKHITSLEELNNLETYYISKYNSLTPNGYNLCPGGQKWRRTPIINESQQQEISLKYESGMSTRELADLYGVTHKTILKYLDNQGIETRNKENNLPDKTSKITREIMQELYVEQKLMLKTIAEMLGVNVKTISRAKNRYNM